MSVENQAQAPDTIQVDNQGGPRIPGLGTPEQKAPNMLGVPGGDKPEQANPDNKGDAPVLDIEALAEALRKQGKEPAGNPDESGATLEPTGNPSIDAGIQMLQKVSGLKDSDMVRAIGKAVEYGDPNLIDTAFINERFGEHAGYAEMLAKAYLDDQVGAAKRAVDEAYSLVGGKENWDGIAKLFAAKAPDNIRMAVKALADSGSIKEAVQLAVETTQNMGLIPKINPQMRGGSGGDGALSSAEFAKEYQALRKEAGNRSLESSQFSGRYQSLLNRRAAGKAKGI